MIGPEVQSALVGVAGLIVAYLGKTGICYLKLKLSKEEKCIKHPVCGQHAQLVAMVRKISEHYEDEKQINLYTEAIKRANSKEN